MKKFISMVSFTLITMLSVYLTGCSVSSSYNSVENENNSSATDTEKKSSNTLKYTETDEIYSDSNNYTEISETTSVPDDTKTEITTDSGTEITTLKVSSSAENTEISKTVISDIQTSVLTEISEVSSEISISAYESFTEISHPNPNIYGYTPKYYQLNAEEQIVYDEIAKGLIQFNKDITIPEGITQAQVKKAYLAVLTTIEQQMYVPVRNYTMMLTEDSGFVTSVQPEYTENYETAENLKIQLETKANEIISKITPEMTTIDIIKLFHDHIILNCSYGQSDYSGSAYGALIDGIAQCEGYSRAMTYLCSKVSIPCEIITGTSNGSAHMWNMIEADGKWYHLDVTWDDPVLANYVQDYISYKYFNLNDSDISGTHKTDENFLYPVAYSSDASYYIYYKLFIDNTENAGQIIKEGISSSIHSGKTSVSFKFDNYEIYNQTIDNLFNNAWENFFIIIDNCNSENGLDIDKNNIRVRKDINNMTIEINF